MILLYVWLMSQFIIVPAKGDQWHDMCTSYGYTLVEAKFGKEKHWLCIKLVDMASLQLTRASGAVLLDPDPIESGNYIQAYPLQDIIMAYGFPVENSQAGSAEGYIGEDGHFYGVLHIGNRTLHADPYDTDDTAKVFGGFNDDYMVAPPRSRRDHDQMNDHIPSLEEFPYNVQEQKRVPGVARARVCDLLLLADKEFFEKDANSSLNHCVRRMVHAVAQADIIFRNADFNEDGVPDNIGFSVKYILVLTSNETNNRVFGDLLSNKTVDGRQYLMRFARLRRLSEVCLGVAFSGHAFLNRTLGLSFTSLGGGMGGAAGGLCDRRAYGRSFNTLALAHATADDKDRIPERITALTLAHEMGHSFGAHHDDNFPNPECKGFLMGSQSSTADDSAHFEFSVCSKRLIAATLSSMSYCLTEENRPYCGNGIVEEGEACDCGMPSRCNQRDPCCTPRAGGALVYEEGTLHKEGCSVAPSATCHPSQGLCCTVDCHYTNLLKHGIVIMFQDCTEMDRECGCSTETSLCRCALGGRCLPDGTCHAAECARLGLKECACYSKGPGGALSRARRCGICCRIEVQGEANGVCVGAEFAAKLIIDNGFKLPDDWPDDDYSGPNVSVDLCHEGKCMTANLRAWPIGDPCVSRGVVGVCTATGICVPRYVVPQSNIYPALMLHNVKMIKTKTKSSSTTVARVSLPLLLILTIYFVK